MKNYLFTLKQYAIILAMLFSGLMITSCDDDDCPDCEDEPTPTPVEEAKTPKYVFFLIGDGMSVPQINLAEAALGNEGFVKKHQKALSNSTGKFGLGDMSITSMQSIGMQTTYAEDRYITGSAASASALACGKKTTIGTISMNGNHNVSYKTMAEMAKQKGKKVGIISSVSIDHATPACFYAHTESRNNYYTIGQHLTESNFDYFAGGGVRWNKYDKEGQPKDINVFLDAARANGYKYVNTRSEFEALTKNDGKVIATIKKFYDNTSDGCALPYVIDLDEFDTDNNITLSEFTEKGIKLLDNENGFFLMVEGGKIDWACHANDAITATHNTVEFDKVVKMAIDFYNQHKDETLIVVTGDHECGGLTLGFAGTGYESTFDFLNLQNVSYVSFSNKVADWRNNGGINFEDALEEVKKSFGLGRSDVDPLLALTANDSTKLERAFNKSMNGESINSEEEFIIYGYYDPFTVTITHILNNKAGIDWTSYSHTGTPVPVFALGQGAEKFIGYYDNTDIGNRIMEIAKYNEDKEDKEVSK